MGFPTTSFKKDNLFMELLKMAHMSQVADSTIKHLVERPKGKAYAICSRIC